MFEMKLLLIYVYTCSLNVSCDADGSSADVAQAIFGTAVALVAPAFTPDAAFNISSTLAEALAQTPQLLPATLASAFSQGIAGTIEFDTEVHTSSYGGGPTLPQTLAVAHACGQDAAIASGTKQVIRVYSSGVNDVQFCLSSNAPSALSIICCSRMST